VKRSNTSNPKEEYLGEVLAKLALNSDFISGKYSDDKIMDILQNAERIHHLGIEYRNREVFAYQLFEPGAAPLSIPDIAARFHEANWPGFTENSTRSKILEILRRLDAFTSEMLDLITGDIGDPELSFEDYLRSLVEDMIGRINLGRLDSRKLRLAIEASIVDILQNEIFRLDRTGEAGEVMVIAPTKFMQYVCGAPDLEAFEKAPATMIRAYELFLFAHERKMEVSGIAKSATQINSHHLQPRYRGRHSIVYEYAGLQQDIDDWHNQAH